MAMSQAAYKVEQMIGDGPAATEQNVSNPALNNNKYGDTSETMKALTWQGKNSVEVGELDQDPVSPLCTVEVD